MKIPDWLFEFLTVGIFNTIFESLKQTTLRRQFTPFVENLARLFNFTKNTQIKLKYTVPRFSGLLKVDTSEGFEVEQITDVLYAVYKISRKYDLTIEGKQGILLLDTFKEKGLCNSVSYLKRLNEVVTKSLDKQFYFVYFSRYEAMVKSFYPMCEAYFTPSQAYLLMILSGCTLGAIYEEKYYVYFGEIALDMTVKNTKLIKFKPSDKWIKFIDVCKFLLPNQNLQNEFRSDLITIIVKNYGDKDFDIYTITMQNLISRLNFNTTSEQI